MTVLNIQEMLSKTEEQRKLIENQMDKSGRKGGFHPEEASILKGQGRADYEDLRETLHTIPLKTLIEYLQGTAGSTAAPGAGYLIPDKVSDILFHAAWMTDLTSATAVVVDTPGSTLKVDYEVTGQFHAKYFGGGGELPEETKQFSQVTITPKSFGVRPAITNDLIEDAAWDVMQIHLENAAKAVAQLSTYNWVATLVSAATGRGTLNTVSSTGAAGICDFHDLVSGWSANAEDGYISDTAIINPYTVADLYADTSVSAYSNEWHNRAMNSQPFLVGTWMGLNINVLCGEHLISGGGNTLYSGSKEQNLVFSKKDAGVVVRKRWLKIEKYSDPIRDLAGAVISAREGYSSINKDAICLITEQ